MATKMLVEYRTKKLKSPEEIQGFSHSGPPGNALHFRDIMKEARDPTFDSRALAPELRSSSRSLDKRKPALPFQVEPVSFFTGVLNSCLSLNSCLNFQSFVSIIRLLYFRSIVVFL